MKIVILTYLLLLCCARAQQVFLGCDDHTDCDKGEYCRDDAVCLPCDVCRLFHDSVDDICPVCVAAPISAFEGLWLIDGGDCDRSACCCLSGLLTVAHVDDDLVFGSRISSENEDCPGSFGANEPYDRNDKLIDISLGDFKYELTVSGNTLVIENTEDSTCSDTATKFVPTLGPIEITKSDRGLIIFSVIVMVLALGCCCFISRKQSADARKNDSQNYHPMLERSEGLKEVDYVAGSSSRKYALFSSKTQKLIMLVTVLQLVAGVIIVVGVHNVLGGLDEVANSIEEEDIPDLGYTTIILSSVPFFSVVFSILLIFSSWRINLYCLYCGVPFFNILFGAVFAVFLFIYGLAYAILLEFDQCSTFEPLVEEEESLRDALQACDRFFDGYRQFLGGSIIILMTIGAQIFLSCFRGCTSTKKETTVTHVVVGQPATSAIYFDSQGL